jgi:glycosyltransferase involved in cell wall biosynthesis
MTNPLVSIIVPVYNGERWVARAIESLWAQGHRPVEVIAVDDGSTDHSLEVLRRFPDLRVLQQTNAGVAAARNAGVALARGEYLAFCDQDDRHVPSKTTKQLAYLDDHPDVALVMGRQRIELEDGMEAPGWLVADEVYGDLGGVLPLSCLVRRKAFDAIGPFDEGMSGSDDFDWVARVKAAGIGVAVLDEVVVLRSIHQTNASHTPGMLRRGTALTMHKLIKARREREQR